MTLGTDTDSDFPTVPNEATKTSGDRTVGRGDFVSVPFPMTILDWHNQGYE